jgi:hypothetical protein
MPIGGKAGLTPGKIALVAWLPGLAVLLEKKSRRMELALYCSCRVCPGPGVYLFGEITQQMRVFVPNPVRVLLETRMRARPAPWNCCVGACCNGGTFATGFSVS